MSSSSADSDGDAALQLERKISQAIDEGHDADTPSGAGYVLDERGERRRKMSIASRRNTSRKKMSDSQRPGSGQRDLEKGAIGNGTDKEDGYGRDDDDNDTNTGHDTDDDANIVWWDSPDDPENPMNWPTWKKTLNIGFVSGMTLVSPLASCKFSLFILAFYDPIPRGAMTC